MLVSQLLVALLNSYVQLAQSQLNETVGVIVASAPLYINRLQDEQHMNSLSTLFPNVHDVGESFYFRVNGIPIFVQVGNDCRVRIDEQ
jgi:hypothetical protein